MEKEKLYALVLILVLIAASTFAILYPYYLSDKESKGDLELVLEYVSGMDNGISNLTFNINDSSIKYNYNNRHYKCKNVETWGYLYDLYLKNRCD